MSLRILIAPLDWGLGHATRSIPIITYLLAEGHEIHVASADKVITLLQKNFHSLLKYHPLPAYNVRYGKRNLITAILLQIPKLLKTIRSEHRLLHKLQEDYAFDFIISDNRYGIYHRDVPSVFITHQVQVLSGMGKWIDKIALRMHRKVIEKFDQLWIVDNEMEHTLAGVLAHPKTFPHIPKEYIGHLSQFNIEDFKKDIDNSNSHITLLLSGPEPARTTLLKEFIQQASLLPQYQFQIISGSSEDQYNLPEHIQLIGLAHKETIIDILRKTQLVICRSGYSTIMDLLAIPCKALLIPTPGQTEQLYLAEYLHAQYNIPITCQELLKLNRQIPEALNSNTRLWNISTLNQEFKKHIDNLIKNKEPLH